MIIKIKSIIHSCKNLDQLSSCKRWVSDLRDRKLISFDTLNYFILVIHEKQGKLKNERL